MKAHLNQNKVTALVVEANKSKDIYKTMDHFKSMSRKASNRNRNEYREALLCLGVDPTTI